MDKTLSKVVFLYVKDNSSKIKTLTQSTTQLFSQKKRLLILTPSPESLHYIDDLLWKYPKDSFLPHSIVDTESTALIALSDRADKNWNQATHLFNLNPAIPPLAFTFECIYEFFDQTSPEKQRYSEAKMEQYSTHQIPLEKWFE